MAWVRIPLCSAFFLVPRSTSEDMVVVGLGQGLELAERLSSELQQRRTWPLCFWPDNPGHSKVSQADHDWCTADRQRQVICVDFT